jgi:hypothetical protein
MLPHTSLQVNPYYGIGFPAILWLTASISPKGISSKQLASLPLVPFLFPDIHPKNQRP